MSDAAYVVHLTESYLFEGEETTEIPAVDVSDHGGMWLVEATDGETKAFGKDEVVEIEEVGEADDQPGVVSSLPPKPIPASVLDDLEQHDRIDAASPMAGGFGAMAGDSDELVFSFVLQMGETHHALVLDEDGDGWKSLGSPDDAGEAMMLIQAFQEEQGQ